jgi:hypothetical protein
LIKTHATDKQQENFNRLQVLKIVLTALQKGDPATSLVVPCDENFQTRVYTTINPDSKNKQEYAKIEQMLNFTNSNFIQGTVQVTTNTIYSTIKKNLETRKTLQDTFQITLYRNHINAKNLTEVGFFATHLVRHDTVECTRWITKVIPTNSPNFQSELITVFPGPPKERITAWVLKMYAEREHASKLAMILQNNFNDKNHTTFIPKEYYESLNPQQKA